MARIKVTRVIEYDGDETWVRNTLAKSLELGKVLSCGIGHSIRITSHHEEPIDINTGTDTVDGREVMHGA